MANEKLDALVKLIGQCRLCTEHPLGSPLPHAPRPVLKIGGNARVLIASQAPGARVHASGVPFTDPSGDRLRKWLGIGADVFYDTSRIAIVPMGFCFPGYDDKGADRPPRVECAPHWRSKLMEHLTKLELILCVGRYAQEWHMAAQCRPTLTETVKNWREPFETLAPRVLPLPHPSWRNSGWLKKNPWFEREVLPPLRREIARLTA